MLPQRLRRLQLLPQLPPPLHLLPRTFPPRPDNQRKTFHPLRLRALRRRRPRLHRQESRPVGNARHYRENGVEFRHGRSWRRAGAVSVGGSACVDVVGQGAVVVAV